MKIRPHQIKAEQFILDDLQKRLKRTRWPEQDEESGWDYGTSLEYMKELTDYWINDYDWRTEEAKLNEFSWFSVEIDGKTIPFIHEKGTGPNPTPIILFHGWPDSVMRYMRLIPMLTNPGKYGGNRKDSFDVVVPAHIGGFPSSEPLTPSPHEIRDVAELSWKLMTEGLGYPGFMAGGGDGGSPISQLLGVHHPESIIGLHLTDQGWHTNWAEHSDLSESEQQYLQSVEMTGYSEGAYAMLQGTRPQTLGIGLNDSPVGMAAWIIEKFRSWSDCNGDLENRYTKNELLTNIMLYWLRKSVKSFSYKEEFVSGSLRPDQPVEVPVGMAFAPNDLMTPVPPRELVSRTLKDIRQWTVLEKGGHFVAMEFPELIAADLRKLLRTLNKF